MNILRGKFWFSQKQGELIELSRPRHKNFVKLDNGKVVEYTEWKSGKWIDEPSNWSDAIYLGEGVYSHAEGGKT